MLLGQPEDVVRERAYGVAHAGVYEFVVCIFARAIIENRVARP